MARRHKQRRGVIVILAAVLLVVMVGMIAFAVDLGVVTVSRTELQSAADAASLAGAARLPEGVALASSTASSYVTQNVVTSTPPGVTSTAGQWDSNTRKFTAGKTPYDAFQVTLQSTNQPVFFGRVFGASSFVAGSSAVAIVRPRDIMLVLDFSGSMNSQNKVDNLKAAVDMFFDVVKQTSMQDRVGFVRYSTNGELVKKLTSNYDEVNNEIQNTKATGWTNIGEGMELALNEINSNGRSTASKMMIIMTDGLANKPDSRDPKGYVLDIATQANAAGIDLETISFGTDADKTLMDEVAAIGNDVYFDVSGSTSDQATELRAVFTKLALKRKVNLVQ
jgi:Flp pilus assembly protein TadG/uncharacterized protein YegL